MHKSCLFFHLHIPYSHLHTHRYTHTHTHAHTHTRACAHSSTYTERKREHSHTMPALFIMYIRSYSAVPPTIAEATDDTVDSNPMLTAGEVLTLTCSAMGTPHPRIEWYREDSKVISCTQSQINDSDANDTTVVSTLVISSVTVGDSGTYECRVKNDAGTTSHQYQVSVSECVYIAIMQILHGVDCMVFFTQWPA